MQHLPYTAKKEKEELKTITKYQKQRIKWKKKQKTSKFFKCDIRTEKFGESNSYLKTVGKLRGQDKCLG